MGQDCLDSLGSDSPDWPHPTPLALQHSALAWFAVEACECRWERLRNADLSLLARAGWILLRKSREVAYG